MTAWTRKLLAATLALALGLGLASTASAQAQNQAVSGRGKVTITIEFRDLDDAAWALKFIDKMKRRGVVRGFEDGTFRPQAALNEAQAVALAVRLLGLEDEAKAAAGSALQFAGADAVPDWARGYVALAIDKKWVDPAEFRPHREASRLWTAVMLVKAMGLEADAQAAASRKLTFRDSDAIPAALVGYVAVAVEQKLVTGFEDGTFRPNQPVTRAQMAALLDRIDGQGAAPRAADEIEGTLVSVAADGQSMIVRVADQERTIKVSPDASVYVDRKPADLTAAPAGAKVEAKLDGSGQAVFVSVEKKEEEERSEVRGIVVRVEPAAGVAPAIGTITGGGATGGTVTGAVYGGTSAEAGSITLLVRAGRHRGSERTYRVAADAEIRQRDKEIALADVRPGVLAELKLKGDVAYKIRVAGGSREDKKNDGKKRAETKREKIDAEGIVVSLEPAKDGKPGRIVIQTGSGEQEFALDADVELEADVKVEGERNAQTFEEVKPGDRVHLKGKDGVVRKIKVQRSARGAGEKRGR